MTRRLWALPLVPFYAAGLALKQAFAPKPRSLTWPVLSIGSLSAGGAGKTPAVIALAELLAASGWAPTILSRGYGRDISRKDGRSAAAGSAPAEVIPHAPDAADRFGDEPTLIAQRTGLPVWVCADRFAAGHAAEKLALAHTFNPTTEEASTESAHIPVHLLDDGFQHRRLARALDIVLVTAEDLVDRLLPAGNRREALTALRRADILILREDEATSLTPRLAPYLRPGTPICIIRRTLRFPGPMKVFGAGARPMAFCGLARPDGFIASLREAGCGVATGVGFPDHHRYTLADMEHLCEVARKNQATGFITTEKDAVKLTLALRSRLEEHGPLMIAALDVTFVEPDAVLAAIQERLA